MPLPSVTSDEWLSSCIMIHSLAIVNKYEINGLKEASSRYLSKKITVDNVADMRLFIATIALVSFFYSSICCSMTVFIYLQIAIHALSLNHLLSSFQWFMPTIHPSIYLFLLLYEIFFYRLLSIQYLLSSFTISCLVSQQFIAAITLLSINLSPNNLSIHLPILFYVNCLYRQLPMHYLFIICYNLLSTFYQFIAAIALLSIYKSIYRPISYFCSIKSVSIDSYPCIISLLVSSKNIDLLLYYLSIYLSIYLTSIYLSISYCCSLSVVFIYSCPCTIALSSVTISKTFHFNSDWFIFHFTSTLIGSYFISLQL